MRQGPMTSEARICAMSRVAVSRRRFRDTETRQVSSLPLALLVVDARRLIIAMSTAVEHQRHQADADDE